MGKSFSDEGYLIIKNAISGKLLVHIQEEISNYLDDFNHNKNKDKKAYYDFFFNKVKSLKGSEYEFQKPIWELLSYKGLIDKFLLEKKIYAAVTDVLGKDLAYINEPSFNLFFKCGFQIEEEMINSDDSVVCVMSRNVQ